MLLLLKATPPPDLAKRLASQGRRGGGMARRTKGMEKQVVQAFHPPTPLPHPHTHTRTSTTNPFFFPFLPSRCHKINVISRVFFLPFL